MESPPRSSPLFFSSLLAGGGTAWIGPAYPYKRDPDFYNAFIYGAPDGVPDGIVEIVNSGENPKTY